MNRDDAVTMDTTRDGAIPVRLTLAGSMTIYEAAAQKGELLAALARAPALELDLGAVDEADTAGLQLLLLLRREAAAGGKPVRVVALSPTLLEVLDRYGLGSAFADLPASDPIPVAEGTP